MSVVIVPSSEPDEALAEELARTVRETSFRDYVARMWTLKDKSGRTVPFRLNGCQRRIDDVWERQWDERGFVRINVLKLRQGGITTYGTARCTHTAVTRPSTSLTLAHDDKLPPVWLRRCRAWRDQIPLPPTIGSTQRSELSFSLLPSRYYVGSAGGSFPGMGDCIHRLHFSELGSWDKSPVSVDPDSVLYDLAPALPTGTNRMGTAQFYESTGKIAGDWWSRTWEAAKAKDSDFENIFLPWYLAEDYRRDDLVGEILELSPYEKDTVRAAKSEGVDLDHAQLAWRRDSLRNAPWHGNVEEWSCRYPATEQEAFLAPGETIYTPAMARAAKATQRDPLGKFNIFCEEGPFQARFQPNASGEMSVWEWPEKAYHYVLGADIQWGEKDTADFDVLHVECIETGRLCAKVRGRFPLYRWGTMIAAVGHLYRDCPVAPERGTKAGNGIVSQLRGLTAEWTYPNVWIRSKSATIRPRVEDFGWLTTEHTKGELIAYSQSQTVKGECDWCDSGSIGQMAVIIRRGDNTIGAPEGMHDDDWMARIITAYVAHVERGMMLTGKAHEQRRDATEEELQFAETIERLEKPLDAEQEEEGLVVG